MFVLPRIVFGKYLEIYYALSICFIVVDADVTVIGSGPGGYVAAIKAAQLGFKVRFTFKVAVGLLVFTKYSASVDMINDFLIL